MSQTRCILSYSQSLNRRSGYEIRDDRRHNRQGSSWRPRRKRGPQSQATGKSKGGWTTEIRALTDPLGKLVRFELIPGNRNDTICVKPLHRLQRSADRHSMRRNWIIDELDEHGAMICISQRPEPAEIALKIYEWRHRLENFVCKLKEFKHIAIQSDKTDDSFHAMLYAVVAMINIR